jgi:hypothetical protein
MQAVIIPELQEELNMIARRYAAEFEQKVRGELSQKKYRASGVLADSVKSVIKPATPTTAPEITIEYEDYGDYLNKKNLIYVKMPPVEKLLEWVQAGKFRRRFVPGYADGAIPKIDEQAQENRIAWAIAKSIKDKKHKRRAWKRAALPKLLRQMNDELTAAWARKTEEIIAQSLSTRK